MFLKVKIFGQCCSESFSETNKYIFLFIPLRLDLRRLKDTQLTIAIEVISPH